MTVCAICGCDTTLLKVRNDWVCERCVEREQLNARDCIHGHLARKCEICELELSITKLGKSRAALLMIAAKHEIVKSNFEAPQSFTYSEQTAWTNGYTCAAREIAQIASRGLKESE